MRKNGRAVWGTVVAVIAATLVVTLFASVLAQRGGRNGPGSGTTLTPTPQPTHTPTPQPTHTLTPAPSAGNIAEWTVARTIGDGNVPTVVFAPTDPRTAYACIVGTSGLIISVTHDSGATWQARGTPIQGIDCHLSVNPTNPLDVVVAQGDSYITLARSFDGGLHWQYPKLGTLAFTAMGWAGSTLYVATNLTDGGASLTNVSVSVNGGSFTRLDTDGKLSGISLADIGPMRFISGSGATVFMQFGQVITPIIEKTLASMDGGKTWALVTFTDGGQIVHLYTTSSDNQTLVGVYDRAPNQAAISHDGGKTWQRLAAASATVPGFNDLWITPDGSLIATSGNLGMISGNDENLYTLTPGATQWKVALVLPVSVYPKAVSWAANGQPIAVWAAFAGNSQASSWELVSHPL